MILIVLIAVMDGLTLYFANKDIAALKKRIEALENPVAEESEEVCG